MAEAGAGEGAVESGGTTVSVVSAIALNGGRSDVQMR